MKNLTVIFLFIGLFFVSSSNHFVATANESAEVKCAMMKFDKAFKNAKAVFVGEVIGMEKDGNKKIFEFKVKRFWKGIKDTKVKVAVRESPRFQAPYDVGETHLVFAKDDENGGLWDGRCSRSRDLDGFSPSLKEDLKKLGDGKTCISLSEESKEIEKN